MRKAIGLAGNKFRTFMESVWHCEKLTPPKALKKIKAMTVSLFQGTGTERKGLNTCLSSE